MRIVFLILFLTCVTHHACSEEPAVDPLSQGDHLEWGKSFEIISGSKSSAPLVLILITNDDPFETQSKIDRIKKKLATKNAKNNRNANSVPPTWCARGFSNTYRKTIERRQDLRGRLVLQSIAAGLPKKLTGDVARNFPQRAVLAICDS